MNAKYKQLHTGSSPKHLDVLGWCALLFAIAVLVISRMDSQAFVRLHLWMDAWITIMALLLAISLAGMQSGNQSRFLRYLSISFFITAAAEFMHSWFALGVVAQGYIASHPMHPVTWTSATYTLPILLLWAFWLARRKVDLRPPLFALSATLLASLIFLLSLRFPPYVDTGLLGIQRPILLPLFPLYGWLIFICWKERSKPLFEGLALMGTLLCASDMFMLYSNSTYEQFALMAHAGKISAYASLLWIALRMSILENQARQAAESKIRQLTKAYAILNQCSQAILRCDNEKDLFAQICQAAVEQGEMRMAWVGMADPQTGRVDPVASFGTGMEYLEGITITTRADQPQGRGTTGTAIRENRPLWIQDFQNDPRLAPWHERAAHYGWASVAALPLHREGQAIGALMLYATEINAFDEPVRNLLEGMAADIDLALDKFSLDTERKLAQQALNDNETRTRLVLDTAMDAVISTDQQGFVIGWNQEAERMFGYSQALALGRDVTDLIVPPSFRQAHRDGMARFLETGKPTIMGKRTEIAGMRADGTEFPVELSLSCTQYHGRYFFSTFIRDITERKRIEAKMQQHAEEQAALLNATRELAVTLDMQQVLQTATDHITELSQMETAAIYLFKEETLFLAATTPPLPPHFPETLRQATLADHPHIGQAITGRQIVFIPDTKTAKLTDAERLAVEQRNLRSILYLPLQAGNKVSGILIAGLSSRTLADADLEIDLCRTLANISALSIENAQLYQNSQHHTRALQDQIDRRKEIEESMRIAAATFESQESIMVTDSEGTILRVNHAFEEMTGYRMEEVVGQNPRILQSGRHDREFYREMWTALSSTGKWFGEIWDKRKDGRIYPKTMTITAVKDKEKLVTHYVAVARDISRRKQSEEEIHRLAFYDPLTGLPNRRLLMDRLLQSTAISARNQHHGALIFLDLDNFKAINDTQGHAVGDLLLIEAAQRLQKCLREGDTVSRLGGDEFVVVLEELSSDTGEASTQAEMVAEKILQELGQPYVLENFECRSPASIGIVLFLGHDESLDDLLKHADTAMYQAKAAGRNTIRFYDPAMQAALEARIELENELRQALNKNQFMLHYQIQIDRQQHPFGAEALLRWEHPVRGLVSPAQFIPLAEETGLIVPVGQWVLQAACDQLRLWHSDAGTRNLSLSVNVSARQFRQADFVSQVRQVLQKSGIKPGRLKLELTESTVLENVEDTIAKMRELKSLGIGFSMDDFGTGYSSLQYLKRLPLDQIKIDQSFVRDIATDPNDAAIVKTIIAMGTALGLNVIAEGVETEAQRAFLEKNGCEAFQGYLFGKPAPPEQIEKMLGDAR